MFFIHIKVHGSFTFVKYWAYLGRWIATRYGLFLLGAHFET
jgi:hypothetical protein